MVIKALPKGISLPLTPHATPQGIFRWPMLKAILETMVERAFSSAGWQGVDRKNLTSENLAQEVLQLLHSAFWHNLVLNRS